MALDGPSSIATLFGLAPCGVVPATDVTAGAVRSYRTFSPLPLDSALRASLGAGLTAKLWRACLERGTKCRVERRYFFCATIRQVTLPGRYPAHCPSEFGLSSPPATSQLPTVGRSSGHLADCDKLIITYRSRFCLLGARFVFPPTPRLRQARRSATRGGGRFGSGFGVADASAVGLLLDAVLLELLVEVAPGRIDHVGGL